jgi:hypothetical protein
VLEARLSAPTISGEPTESDKLHASEHCRRGADGEDRRIQGIRVDGWFLGVLNFSFCCPAGVVSTSGGEVA